MADTNKTTNTPDLGDKPELGNGKDGSGSYQMRVGFQYTEDKMPFSAS